jgi:DNA-binding NarL/FixJ family response regulator
MTRRRLQGLERVLGVNALFSTATREVEVLKLVAEGHTSRDIADTLFISIKTVHRHRASLLDQLKLRDRVDLTR